MIIRQLLRFVPAVLAIGLLSTSAAAGAASDLVRQKQTKLFATVARPKTAARQADLQRLFDGMLDYQAFAEGSLGKKWKERTEEERVRFRDLLEKLVRNNYKRNLKKMLDYQVQYRGEDAAENGSIIVHTMAKHKTDTREPALQIDFRLAKVGGGYKVVDIITENASMVKTYRSQFLRIIRKKSFAKLIEKLEKKLAKQD